MSFSGNKLVRLACGAVALCGALAGMHAWRTAPDRPVGKQPTRGWVHAAEWRPIGCVSLPAPGPLPGEPTSPAAPRASTREEQAKAMNSVAAGSLVRALSQAAAQGDARTVDNLLKDLPRYGETAREKIEEELTRTKSPKSREALTRALAELRS